MSIERLLNTLAVSWAIPRAALHKGAQTAFLLRCTVVTQPLQQRVNDKVPDSLRQLWGSFVTARLFEDVRYGQWGLILLSKEESETQTEQLESQQSRDFAAGDRVVGRFLGDQDLLVVRCDPDLDDYGHVLVSLPLDPRSEWYHVADNLESFLERYAVEQGTKFWEE